MTTFLALTATRSTSWLRSLRMRLLVAFAAMALLTFMLGLVATDAVRRSGGAVVSVFGHALMATSYARSAAAEFASMDAASARAAAAADPVQRTVHETKVDETAELVFQDLQIAEERAATETAREAARRAAVAVRAWLAARATAGDGESESLRVLTEEAAEKIDLLINTVAGDAFHQKQDAEAAIGAMTLRSGLSTVAVTLLGLAAAFVLARQLLGPVRAASAAAASIAAGHLETELPPGGTDELGTLLTAMAVMRDAIRATIETEKSERVGAQRRLADTMEGSTEGVVLVGGDGRVAASNDRAHQLLPQASKQMQPGGLWRRALAAGLGAQAAAAANSSEAIVLEHQGPLGSWIRLSCSPARSGGGSVAILSDISGIKRHEAQLAAANRKIQAALTNMKQGLCMIAPEGIVMVCNDRFCELFGLPDADFVTGMTRTELAEAAEAVLRFPDEVLADLLTGPLAAANNPGAASLVRATPAGETISVQHETLGDGSWIATYDDLTALRRAEREVEYMAQHDGLTRLPNRAQFRARLDQMVAGVEQSGPFALVNVDLRRFRGLNEGSGSAVGDAVLRGAADRLLGCVRDADLVARTGGDEFAILQVGIERAENAGLLAERIVDAMRAPFVIGGEAFSVGVDVGIAICPGDADRPDRLLQLADTALARAKQDAGSSFRFFAPDMDKRLADRRTMEAELEQALHEGQLVMHYQPLVDLASGRVSSFEALLRWRHPVRGMVPPGAFIPLAEETGLIGPIGDWVLHQACRDAASWPEGIKVGINVSPLQFGNPALVATVLDAIAAAGLAPHRVELEITESVFLNDGSSTMAALRKLHEHGIGIAIDDFGTGYSSLATLRSFPFQKLKIDKSFIDDLARTEEAQVIVSAIIGLGRNLRMRVTAEGVETEEQLAHLRAFGNDEIQGYLFGKPVALTEVAGTIRRIELLPEAVLAA